MHRLRAGVVATVVVASTLSGCAAPQTAGPAPSETVSEPEAPSVPPVREQLTIDFPAFIPLPEGVVTLQQETSVQQDTYWTVHVSTDAPFEEVVAPVIAAGSLDQISYADSRGPGTADGTGMAVVFIAGQRVSLSVSRVNLEREFTAAYTVQPGAQPEVAVLPWPPAGSGTADWTTAVPDAVPAAFPADLPLPDRPPIRPRIAGLPGAVYDGVEAVRARWLTRDETEVERLLQSWSEAGWELEHRSNRQGVLAIVRKGPVQVLISFDYTDSYNAWELLIDVWDPSA